MKKLIILLLAFSLVGLFSCRDYYNYNLPEKEHVEKILNTTDKIYMDIRLVITSPEVLPMFTDEELKTLVELEKRYLEVVSILREYPDDSSALKRISVIAEEILNVLELVSFVPAASPYVTAAKVSLRILQNHI